MEYKRKILPTNKSSFFNDLLLIFKKSWQAPLIKLFELKIVKTTLFFLPLKQRYFLKWHYSPYLWNGTVLPYKRWVINKKGRTNRKESANWATEF